MKIIVFLQVYLFLIIFTYGQELTLTIDLEKKQYFVEELIPVISELTNSNKTSIYILGFNPEIDIGGLRFIIRDSNGMPIQDENFGIVHTYLEKYKELKSGESAIIISNIKKFFNLHPGDYSIQAIFHYYYYDTITKIKTEKDYFSDYKYFSIVEPNDSENIKVLSMLREIKKFPREKKIGEDIILKLESIINNYPNSRYIPTIYYKLILNLSVKNDNKVEKYINEIFLKLPNSFITLYCLDDSFKKKIIRNKNLQNMITNKKILEYLHKRHNFLRKIKG